MRAFLLYLAFAICAAAQNPLEQAVTLTRAKRYAEARQLLADVAEPQTTAQRIAFRRLKAAVASGMGEAPEAAREMRSALALQPEDGPLLFATAVAEFQAVELERALEHARAAPESAAREELIADIEEKRSAFVEAAQAYQKAVELAPDREDYRIALAFELVQHHTFLPAVEVLEQGAKLFPKSARIRALLGIAQYASDATGAAIASLVNAVSIDPALEPAWTYLSRIVLESSASPAPDAMKALCGWNQTVCAALELRTAHEQDDAALYDAAVAKLRSAAPGEATARCELGRAYQWRAQWKAAREQMEACVKAVPEAQNHYRLGLIYAELGLADLARREMRIRNELLQNASVESQRRLDAVQAFRYSAK